MTSGSNQIAVWLHTAPARVRWMLGLCCLLGLAVIGNIGLTVVMDYHSRLTEAVEMKTLELQRLRRNVASMQEYEELHTSVLALRDEIFTSGLVKAGTPSLSEAMFQQIVNDWADTAQVSILSLRILPRVDRDGFSQMRMAINARAEIGAIQTFMGLVRQSPRFVFFEEVEIRTISAQERRYYYFNAQLAAWTVVP